MVPPAAFGALSQSVWKSISSPPLEVSSSIQKMSRNLFRRLRNERDCVDQGKPKRLTHYLEPSFWTSLTILPRRRVPNGGLSFPWTLEALIELLEIRTNCDIRSRTFPTKANPDLSCSVHPSCGQWRHHCNLTRHGSYDRTFDP